MQGIADLRFERASTHAAVIFHASDHRPDGLAPLHPASLRWRQFLGLAALKHFHTCNRLSEVAQVNDHRLGLEPRQDLDLFQLRCLRIAVAGIAWDAARTDDQTLLRP